MTTTKAYNFLNRLTNLASVSSVASAVNFDYTDNTATVSLWSKDSTALYTPTTRKG